MRKILVILALASFICTFPSLVPAADQSGGPAAAAADIAKHSSCKYCGMNRGSFAHSRVLIEYEDGTSEGTCSIHCAALELALALDRAPKMISVGDFKTKELIDVDKAFWVIGGSKPGVMSKNAKWAFADKGDAESYIKQNGGTLANFDQAISAAYSDMYQDTKMIRERRKAKRQGQHK